MRTRRSKLFRAKKKITLDDPSLNNSVPSRCQCVSHLSLYDVSDPLLLTYSSQLWSNYERVVSVQISSHRRCSVSLGKGTRPHRESGRNPPLSFLIPSRLALECYFITDTIIPSLSYIHQRAINLLLLSAFTSVVKETYSVLSKYWL